MYCEAQNAWMFCTVEGCIGYCLTCQCEEARREDRCEESGRIVSSECKTARNAAQHFLVIQHPSQDSNSILVSRVSHCVIPSYAEEAAHRAMENPFRDVDRWTTVVCKYFGLSFRLCYRFRLWRHRDRDSSRSVLICECMDGDGIEIPSNLVWRPLDEVIGTLPQHFPRTARDALGRFSDAERLKTAKCVPLFLQRGWIQQEIIPWLRGQLSPKIVTVDNLELVGMRYTGAVLRLKCSGETLYVKVSAPFVNEAAVYDALLCAFPRVIARPLVCDVQRRIVLLQDLGKPRNMVVERERLPRDKANAFIDNWLVELAAMHKACMGRHEVWKQAGVKDVCDVSGFHKKVEPIVQTLRDMRKISDVECAQLLGDMDEIRADADVVQSLGVPCTLIHSDVDTTNVCDAPDKRPNKHVLIDWAECCLSHPLFDEIWNGSRDACLNEWIHHCRRHEHESDDEVRRRLRAGQSRAQKLKPLMNAVRILEEIEDDVCCTCESCAPLRAMMGDEMAENMLHLRNSYLPVDVEASRRRQMAFRRARRERKLRNNSG